jgi:hypothetical protein
MIHRVTKKDMMRAFTIPAAMAIVAVSAGSASAQDPAGPGGGTGGGRPYLGLFAAAVENLQQTMTLTLSAGTGYDANIDSRAAGNIGIPVRSVSSAFAQTTASLRYGLNRDSVGASVSVGGSLSHYSRLEQDPWITRQYANGGAWWRWPITPRTSLTLGVTGTYRPLLFAGSLPVVFDTEAQKVVFAKIGQALLEEFGQPIDLGLEPTTAILDPGVPTEVVNQTSWLGRVQFSHNLTRRVDFTAEYGRGAFDSTFGGDGYRSEHVTVTFGVALSRGLGLRVGGGDIKHGYTAAGQRQEHHTRTANAGLVLNHGFSLTRKTTLSFNTSTNALTDGARTRYRLNGNVELNYEIGRSWTAGMAIRRHGEYIGSFRQPVLHDGFSAGVGGMIGRRFKVQTSIGGRWGSVGFASGGNDFSAYHASAGLHAGFTQSLGAGVSYGYYRYEFGSAVQLPTGVTPRVNRQSIQAYVNLWVPILQQRGRS